MGILNNQKMGLIYMGQYRWNSGKFWGTSECSQAGQTISGMKTPVDRRKSKAVLLSMPLAMVFKVVISDLSFLLVLDTNNGGQSSDVDHAHLHQASSCCASWVPQVRSFSLSFPDLKCCPNSIFVGPPQDWWVGAGGLALQLISFYFYGMISVLPQDSPLIFKSCLRVAKLNVYNYFYSQSNHPTFFEKLRSHKGSWQKKTIN